MGMGRLTLVALGCSLLAASSEGKLPDMDAGGIYDHMLDHDYYGEHDIFGGDADGFSRDWIEHVVNFELKESEFFYEDVTEANTVIKGGFFAAGGAKSGIQFQILNPSLVEVYTSQGKPDVFFSVKAEQVGTYTFHFSTSKTQQVSFIVGTGKKGALKKEQVKTIEDQIKTIDRELRDIQHEGSYLWSRQKSHLKTVEAINSRVFWFTLVEFLVLVAVAGFQVFYVKNLLSHRRLY